MAKNFDRGGPSAGGGPEVDDSTLHAIVYGEGEDNAPPARNIHQLRHEAIAATPYSHLSASRLVTIIKSQRRPGTSSLRLS